MKQLYKSLLFTLACTATTSLYAQEVKTEENQAEDSAVYKEIYEAKKTVEAKDKEISSLGDQIVRLNQEIVRLNQEKELLEKDLQQEKESQNKTVIQELKKEVKNLKKANSNLLQEKAAAIDSVVDIANKQQAEYETLRQKDANTLAAQSMEIKELKTELKNLGNFKQRWLKELAASVDEKWLDKSYTEIDARQLEREARQYQEFAATDTAVQIAYEKLAVVEKEYKIYTEAVRCLNSPYHAKSVKDAAQQVRDIKEQLTGKKAEEMKAVYSQLMDYEITVEFFQELIKKVDEDTKNMNDIFNVAKQIAKNTIDKLEKEEEYVTAIKAIPWLNQQLEIYQNCWEEEDCYQKNAVRDSILGIQLTK